jgi:catechol 2,3-dioxygenase-like lactoylglutathione lyase family enzyme
VIDHVSLGVSDLDASRRFYDAVLRPLGLMRTLDFEERGSDYGFAAGQMGVEFTITLEPAPVTPASGMHLCFRAPDRAAVRAFHAAAISHGGTDDGRPGLRAYHPDYYAAFVRDPDGHRIEAVCHLPGESAG